MRQRDPTREVKFIEPRGSRLRRERNGGLRAGLEAEFLVERKLLE